jgi:putative hemolysin
VSARDGRVFALDWPRSLAARRVLEHASGLARLERLYRTRPSGLAGEGFLAWTLELFGVEVRVDAADLARIPASGPLLVVANHPFGGMEGIALALVLARVRKDARVLANVLLGRIPEIREHVLLVDPFARPGSTGANARSLRRALGWLRGGHALAVFPAGEVASLDLRMRRVADPPWHKSIAALARRAGAPAVPVFIPGRNGALFQTAGVVHPLLRTALLPRAFMAAAGTTIELRVGTPIPAARLAELASDERAIGYLRDRTEILAERTPVGRARGLTAVQPRRTPPAAPPIVPAVDKDLLAAEVAALPHEARLVTADDLAVYVSRAARIPNVLREIGRLREVTFRDAGEGTGRAIDLDVFDAAYLHLFIWSEGDREIVGAYRLGPTDEILPASGVGGLYTASLFKFDPRLFAAMGPALEMGRSWIRTEHQKSYAGLMLLWKGIGELVGRQPRYATLFGPVSISAEYRSRSQQLIVAFLERNRRLAAWAPWVRPTNPFREPRGGGAPGPSQLADLEDVSTFISEIEADQKGVPVLLKQYLRLDGRLLSYNVDPEFANVLDVLILVDLRRSPEKALQRYMGRDNLARFRAYHADRGHAPLSYQIGGRGEL